MADTCREVPTMAQGTARISLADRFWAKVKTDGPCWLWTGAQMGSLGYGQFRIDPARTDYAHRVSWRLANGEIPDGALVLHRCDVPLCVRPDHLYLGNQADNMRDAFVSNAIRRTRPAAPIGEAVISVRMPIDVLTKLDEACASEQETRSAVIRRAISRYHERRG